MQNHKMLKSCRNLVFIGNHNLQVLKRSHHKVCIIGSGPAGFYAAQHLLKLKPSSKIDIYEKLPVPFGLVRYGVAPDHPEVKNVINTFNTVLKNPNVNFVGNFEAGKDISLGQLRDAYHAVLLAHGASEDRKLQIPGENHVLSAREFVGWYNGLPENRNLPIDFRNATRAVIIGQGNVALDIARMLLSPIEILEKTDISPYALEALKFSGIKEVVIIGRRGPLQVSFTIKELRELFNLKDVGAFADSNDFGGINETFLGELQRPRRRLTELLLKIANNSEKNPVTKSWSLKFMRSPKEVVKENKLLKLTLEINQYDPQNKESVIPTGKTETEICDVIFRSVGYKGRRIFSELPFNENSGVIPNVNGKIENGIFCCGWAGQGPRGVILTTMQNSFEVAKVISNEMDGDKTVKQGFEMIENLMPKNKRFTFYKDFAKIVVFEAKNNRKVTSVEEMFDVINGKL